MPDPLRYIALVAAAGIGTRLGSDEPKQYLRLGARSMLEHSIAALLVDARIERVFVVVAPNDKQWRSIVPHAERVEFLAVGGASRAESVRNGLRTIATRTHADDRVLVHDAARPCLGASELARLLDQVGNDPRGGLLAMPVADTLKRGDSGGVVATVERDGLWFAQTPQMFRVASLRAALEVEPLDAVTDEASAVERMGDSPLLVRGSPTNIKVTNAEDLTLACAILEARQKAQSSAAY